MKKNSNSAVSLSLGMSAKKHSQRTKECFSLVNRVFGSKNIRILASAVAINITMR